MNKRVFGRLAAAPVSKREEKGHFCEDGRAWHPVCHHSDDGDYSKQGWTSPFPRQVSGTSGIFVVAVVIVVLRCHCRCCWRTTSSVDINRWLLTGRLAGLVRYLHPSDEELRQFAPAPRY